MSLLKYCYKTRIEFTERVHTHHFLLRCLPFENQIQRVLESQLVILPEGIVNLNVDSFGNKIITGYLDGFHNFFEFSSEGLVETKPYRIEELLNPLYLYPSRLTSPVPAIREMYESLDRSLPVHERVALISEQMTSVLQYQSGMTTIHTTAGEALSLGIGVCQDFSHLMISLLRLGRVPARYVAGLIGGEGFTHAWVEYYVDGYWYAFDPTHNCKINTGYVKIAQGRDYDDCPIDKGVFRGLVQQKLEVSVKVEQEQQ